MFQIAPFLSTARLILVLIPPRLGMSRSKMFCNPRRRFAFYVFEHGDIPLKANKNGLRSISVFLLYLCCCTCTRVLYAYIRVTNFERWKITVCFQLQSFKMSVRLWRWPDASMIYYVRPRQRPIKLVAVSCYIDCEKRFITELWLSAS